MDVVTTPNAAPWWDLKLWLQTALRREISVEELRTATGLSRHKWYGDKTRGIQGRNGADDFPNAEEVRQVASYFQINLIDLLVGFELVDFDDLSSYIEEKGGTAPPHCAPRRKGVIGRIAGNRSVRPDAPTL